MTKFDRKHNHECSCNTCKVFRRIFRTYPQFYQYLASLKNAEATYKAWVDKLSELVDADLHQAGDDVIRGIEKVDKAWDLPHQLFERAKYYESKRLNAEYVVDVSRRATVREGVKEVRRDPDCALATTLGRMVQDGIITKEENDSCWESTDGGPIRWMSDPPNFKFVPARAKELIGKHDQPIEDMQA